MRNVICFLALALTTYGASAEVSLPSGGPIGQLMVPFENGQFHLIYQLSRKSAPESRCHGMAGGHAVLISATNNRMFPRTTPYADGCWFANKGNHVVILARTMQDPFEFVHTYPAVDFDKAADFWQVATGAQ